MNNMINQKIWQGVNYLLDEYAMVKAEDKVIIAYTKKSRESAAWVSHALELRNIEVNVIWMKPLKDDGFYDRFVNVLPQKENLTGQKKLHIMTFELDTLSHTNEIRKALSAYDERNYLIIRAMSACPELFSHALHAKPKELLGRNATILQRCMQANTLRIKCPGGTDLKVHLDSERFRWISNHGAWRERDTLILPAGEVATYPDCIEGTLVANFAFNLNAFTSIDTRLETSPIKVFIEKGKATDFECENIKMKGIVAKCFNSPNGMNVGELGFGTNYCVQHAIPLNSHINERCPGVHLGFGQHNQSSNLYESQTHLDLITKGGFIWVDEDSIPLNLDNIAPSLNPHPLNCQAEDVFAPNSNRDLTNDCCGIIKC
jgi:leucyl aminopeptidase (aminopeptidase T)